MTQDVQLLGISNAIVDVLAHVDDAFLEKIGTSKGSMLLIDEARAKEVYSMMGPATEMSGGSVANTVAGIALLGGTGAYIGKVRDDQLGEIFNHDMRSLGINVRLEPARSGAPTARSHVLITDDGQRTMNTYLGACTELGLADITEATVGSPQCVLLEGYVWDIAEGPALAKKAIEIARRNGAAIALSLSDSMCVERHKAAFVELVENDADLVLGDQDEVEMLLGTSNMQETLAAIEGRSTLFVITRGPEGSVIYADGSVIEQAAKRIDKVIDTTGAGDAYTAGFLYGWANGWDLKDAARLGTHVASNVIQQVGARFESGLLESFER